MLAHFILSWVVACSMESWSVPESLSVQSIEQVSVLPASISEMTRIYFIRNAQTEFQKLDERGVKYTTGKSPSVPLTMHGMEQAKRLGEAFSSLATQSLLYIPPALRAEQTAEQILLQNSAIRFGGAVEGLLEVGMGEWEGKRKDEAYQEVYGIWKALPAEQKFFTPKVASGESYYEASERALKDLQEIVDQSGDRTLLIISGENLLNALAMRWSRPQFSTEPGSDLPMLPTEECDFYLVEIPRGHAIEEGRLVTLVQTGF